MTPRRSLPSLPLRRLALVGAVLVAVGTACGSLEPAAAIVNGEKISEEALQEEVDRVRDDPSFQELLRQQGDAIRGIARRQVLTRFIRETLVDQEADRRGIRVSSAQIGAFVDDLREEVGGEQRFRQLLEQSNLDDARVRVLARRQVLQQELEKQLTADLSVGDDEVAAWYEQNKAQLAEYRLQKIVVESQDAASSVVEEANGGADFARLARDRSTDESARSGGDVGYVDAGTLGNALAAQVDAAAVGAVVGPVRGPEGFEVYKVVDKRSKPLDAVRGEIADQLLSSERRAAFDTWIADALQRARIVVNPKYGRFDDRSLTVVGSEQPSGE